MTDEQRIGESGEENVLRPEPAGGDRPAGSTAQGTKPAATDDSDEAWSEEERNEEAVTHGSP